MMGMHFQNTWQATKIFKIKVISTFKKPLQRLNIEALMIQTSEADFLLNSKKEFKQPAQFRVVRTRENNDPRLQGERGREAGGERRAGAGGGRGVGA